MPSRSPTVVVGALVASALLGGGTLSYYEESLPSTMNPLFARSMVDRRSHELVFDRLFYRSAITSAIKSRLVENAVVGDEGRTVRLELKSGIKWHDGQPLKAADICFTIDAMRDPGTPSQMSKAYQEVIVGCRVVKGDAVIEMTDAYHNPTERLSFPVLPAHVFDGNTAIQPDHAFSARPIGTGPMKGSKGRREVRFTAVPNAHHAAQVPVAQLGEGGDPLVQVRTLMNGGVHGVVSVAPPLRREIAASDDVALKSYDLRSWWFIALNTVKQPLADPNVRKAINLSIDREELRRLTMGYDPEDVVQPCQFVSGPFVPASPYYNRSVKVATRSNANAAAATMERAGAVREAGQWVVGGQPVVLKIGMNAPLDLEATDLLNQVGNQLQSAGFGRQVHKVSSDDWTQRAVTGQLGDFDMLVGKWSFGVVENVAPLFESRVGGKGSLNIFNYTNSLVDTLVQQFDNAKTDTAAQDAYHALHAFLAEDLPYLFLWKLDTKSAWRNEVRGNTITPFFYFTEFDGWSLE